ncbi:hypothetical protein B0H11DRAFT_2368808 [Mycena galericulata]|nr:hypothetical protein B0H11DRAFT_2368808 [Mycena galericulata]
MAPWRTAIYASSSGCLRAVVRSWSTFGYLGLGSAMFGYVRLLRVDTDISSQLVKNLDEGCHWATLVYHCVYLWLPVVGRGRPRYTNIDQHTPTYTNVAKLGLRRIDIRGWNAVNPRSVRESTIQSPQANLALYLAKSGWRLVLRSYSTPSKLTPTQGGLSRLKPVISVDDVESHSSSPCILNDAEANGVPTLVADVLNRDLPPRSQVNTGASMNHDGKDKLLIPLWASGVAPGSVRLN